MFKGCLSTRVPLDMRKDFLSIFDSLYTFGKVCLFKKGINEMNQKVNRTTKKVHVSVLLFLSSFDGRLLGPHFD